MERQPVTIYIKMNLQQQEDSGNTTHYDERNGPTQYSKGFKTAEKPNTKTKSKKPTISARNRKKNHEKQLNGQFKPYLCTISTFFSFFLFYNGTQNHHNPEQSPARRKNTRNDDSERTNQSIFYLSKVLTFTDIHRAKR